MRNLSITHIIVDYFEGLYNSSSCELRGRFHHQHQPYGRPFANTMGYAALFRCPIRSLCIMLPSISHPRSCYNVRHSGQVQHGGECFLHQSVYENYVCVYD